MFLVDKYTPSNLDDNYFHHNIIEKLGVMSKDMCIPHIIFYGPSGSGKKTLINIFLEMLYGKGINNTEYVTYKVKGSGNNTTLVPVKQSYNHIVIEPGNNNFDRYLVQEIVKTYASRQLVNMFGTKKPFKVVLINNIGNMSYYAQTALRRTMEVYSGSCRFIIWCRTLSKVIDPLKSRCMCIRVQSPENSDIFKFIYRISVAEEIKLKAMDYVDIIRKSDHNIKKAVWELELKKLGIPSETTYQDTIKQIVSILIHKNPYKLYDLRALVYEIIITNIDCIDIIRDLTDALIGHKSLTSSRCRLRKQQQPPMPLRCGR